MACRAITGAWKSTPTAALEAMLSLPPLHVFIETEAISTLNRLVNMNDIQLRNVRYTNIWLETITTDTDFNMPTDKIKPELRADKKFSTFVPLPETWFQGELPPKQGIVIYTDGSLIEGSAGAGVFCNDPLNETSISLGKYSSIFLAEIKAILDSVHWIKERCPKRDVFICTDSQSALKALSAYEFTSALALNAYEALNELALTTKVEIIWVPSHSGIEGNEKADELAKIGAMSKFTGPEPVMSLILRGK